MKKNNIDLILFLVFISVGLWYVNDIAEKHDALIKSYVEERQEELAFEFYQDSLNRVYKEPELLASEDPKPIKRRKKKVVKEVTITKYHPVANQTDNTPLQTADLSKISMAKLYRGKIKWVAVSRDLLKEYGYGSKIRISTGDPDIDGVYEVHDTMNPRFVSRVDILSHPKHSLGKGLWTGKIRKF